MDIDKRGIPNPGLNRPQQRPVFDIAPPRPVTSVTADVPVADAPAPSPKLDLAQVDISSAPASAPTGSIISPSSTTPTEPLPETPAAPPAASQSPQDKPKKKKTSKKPLLISLLALVILAGAGGGAYYFLTMKDSKPTPAATTPNEADTMQEPATGATIDAALTDIDTALASLNDTSDFDETAFNDDTLGL